MKHAILSVLTVFLIFPSMSSDHINENNHSFLYDNYFDPGHKQKRGSQLGKDRSAIELYLGSQASVALKLNFYGAKHGALTERGYIMAGFDFDSDIYAKFGYVLNPGKRNKNKSLSASKFGWWRLWRYVMIRKAIEIGYKGHFLDGASEVSALPRGEENPAYYYVNVDSKEPSKNYGGFTANYTWIFDGNFLFDKTAWYFFDHRTARRIRLKIDAGLFFSLDKFKQHHIGSFSGSSETNGYMLNDAEPDTDGDGDFMLMETYPVISPFLNVSIGFAF
mgnify:CR=1 FL=1